MSGVYEDRDGLAPHHQRSVPFYKRWLDALRPSGPESPFAEEEEDDPLLPSAIKRRQKRFPWSRYAFYLILLVLGGIIGGLITKLLSRAQISDRDRIGPLVPPVFTFPPPTGLPRNPAYLIEASTGAVASEDVTCSNLGVSILRDRNGTAVDAAITTALCIGLLNAFASGIGGGGFMVIRVPDGEHKEMLSDEFKQSGIIAIDFRETSPAASEKEMYGVKHAGRVASAVGGLAIGVPGELRGLELAHKLYGSLSWEEVVMPVAELAKGWQVSRELARRIRIFGQFMLDDPTWKKIYAPQGYLAVEGDFMQRSAYGKTLEHIARHGAGSFYTGKIAESMVGTIRAQGGVITLEDLANYSTRAYPAIHQTWHNKTVYTTGAPSSGGPLLAILNLLEPYGFASTPASQGGCNSAYNTHLLLEAMKLAFGARSEIVDPAFASDEQKDRQSKVYTKEWAENKRKKITNSTHDIDYYGLKHDTPIDHGTTSLSVLDQWGGAASITTTVNLIWGSHVMDEETGVIFNDEQDDFAVPGAADAFGLWPSPWNYPAPNKKPLSSTAATIIMHPNNTIYSILGGSGGSRIFPSIAQVLLNLECGLDLSEAIERPRVHNQVVPPVSTVEVGPGFLAGEWGDIVSGLEARGHEVGQFDINIGVSEIQAILIEGERIWASSDSRKNGIAAGY